jgi:FixJ family two-component response regulator
LVYVVDDDESMRRALDRLLRSADFRTEVFASAQGFLVRSRPGGACLVLDVRMPGMTGLELQKRLASTRPDLPVVLITAYATEALRQQALASGASAFLTKPFEDSELLQAVERAIKGNWPIDR